MDWIALNRIQITGPIYIDTPMCVIREIAGAHGISYEEDIPLEQLLHSIREQENIMVHVSFLPSEAGDVARFVNHETPWNVRSLIIAFDHLRTFMNVGDPLSVLSTSFTVGRPTNEDPTKIGACILYAVCRRHLITVNRTTTLEQLELLVRTFLSHDLLPKVMRYIATITSAELINLIGLERLVAVNALELNTEGSTESNTVESIDYDTLLSLVPWCSNNDTPNTYAEAIALGAIAFSVDLSAAENPMLEFNILVQHGYSYVPQDKRQLALFELNPYLINLRTTFNPLYPLAYYEPSLLYELYIAEGGEEDSTISDEERYEFLQMGYLCETFYVGRYPQLTSETTKIDLMSFDDIPSGNLLSYGTRNYLMEPVSIGELISLFSTNKNFSNPFRNGSAFSRESMCKLKAICRSGLNLRDNVVASSLMDALAERQRLFEVIKETEVSINSLDTRSKALLSVYESCSEEDKTKINSSFNSLLDLSMYMRGWKGPNFAYPIREALVPIEGQATVALRVTEAMVELNRSLHSLPTSMEEFFLDLPLIRYEGQEFRISNDVLEGLTIRDRLRIVSEGESSSNTASCIRLSSNWLAATAHHYLTTLGVPEPFVADDLRHIS